MRSKAVQAKWGFTLHAIAAATALGWAGSAAAMSIDVGNRDVRLRWDNTVRYNLGTRIEEQDPRIMRNSFYDESDGKFDQHDIVTNRLDWMSELDMSYKGKVGVRLSGAAWYDNAYQDTTVRSRVPGFQTSYNNDRYSREVERYVKEGGEILDAFVWTNLKLGSTPVNVKLGQHTVYWGETLLTPFHAVAYSQAPLDAVKLATSPGIEIKEIFLPLKQVSASAQLSGAFSVAAQYFLDWDNTRIPYGGTYFGIVDFMFEGQDRLQLTPGPVSFQRAPSLEPKKRGNWGVSARYNMEAIESSFGAYYREFDDYLPFYVPQTLSPSVGANRYRLIYPQNTKQYSVSFARVIGPVSFGSDLSYRKNAALTSNGIDPNNHDGARGDTTHAVFNGIYLLTKTPFWDTGVLVAEFAYSHLEKVTKNAGNFAGEGTPGCRSAGNSVTLPGNFTRGNRTDGCATKNYWGMAVNFTPQYLQLFPSWDFEVPITVNYGIKGNAPTNGGGNEGELAWSLGTKFTYQQKYEFGLRYADIKVDTKYGTSNGAQQVIGGNGGKVGTTDRGWLAFTFKTSF